MRMLWRPLRLESLADRREGRCRGFAEGLANSEHTNNLLPPTRLESHARILRNAITLNCASEHHASKKVLSHDTSTS